MWWSQIRCNKCLHCHLEGQLLDSIRSLKNMQHQ